MFEDANSVLINVVLEPDQLFPRKADLMARILQRRAIDSRTWHSCSFFVLLPTSLHIRLPQIMSPVFSTLGMRDTIQELYAPVELLVVRELGSDKRFEPVSFQLFFNGAHQALPRNDKCPGSFSVLWVRNSCYNHLLHFRIPGQQLFDLSRWYLLVHALDQLLEAAAHEEPAVG